MLATFPTDLAAQLLPDVSQGHSPEPYLNGRETARVLGLKYHQIQRAAARGCIPSYRPFGRRRYFLISETVAFIKASQQGGAK